MSIFVKRQLNVKNLIRDCGNNADIAAQKIETWLSLPKNDPKHLKPEDFSIYQIAEACKKKEYADQVLFTMPEDMLSEAVQVSQFSTITGTLLSKKMKDAWDNQPGIVDDLYTPFPSNLQTDTIPQVWLESNIAEVKPGMPYPHSADAAEDYVTVGHEKRGEILDITEEAIRFDQTGLLMKRAEAFGMQAKLDREKRGVYTFMDITVNGVNYYAYYYKGTREAVWADADTTTNGHYYDNKITDVLTDYTDIAAAEKLLNLMGDNNQDPIVVTPTTLVVPVTLKTKAWRLINNEFLPGGTNEERNPYANNFKVLSSPLIDNSGDTNATTNWWLGEFKKMFVEKIVIPLEIKRRTKTTDNEEAWNSDIVASYKIRYDSKFAAVDYRYGVKSTGGG